MENQENPEDRSEEKFEEDAFKKIIDIKSDPEVVNHVTSIFQINEVLREGLITAKFARRIKKENFRTSIPSTNMIMFNHGIELFTDFLKKVPHPVGIITRREDKKLWSGSYFKGIRIPPRKFVGFLLNPEDSDFDKDAETLITSIKKLRTPLPIYSTSGELIWPRQMSYDEIVQMLSEEGQK